MSINYRPLGNRILIKPIKDEEEQKIGAIIMADSAIIFAKGEVIAVGRGEIAVQTGKLISPELKKGDVVLFGKNAPYLPIMVEGVEHRLMRETDIEAVV